MGTVAQSPIWGWSPTSLSFTTYYDFSPYTDQILNSQVTFTLWSNTTQIFPQTPAVFIIPDAAGAPAGSWTLIPSTGITLDLGSYDNVTIALQVTSPIARNKVKQLNYPMQQLQVNGGCGSRRM